MEAEPSRTSVSKKEKLALAKLPPSLAATAGRQGTARNLMSPNEAPSTPTANRKASIASLGSPGAAGVGMSGSSAGVNRKASLATSQSNALAAAKAAEEQKARQLEEKRRAVNARQFIDGLIKSSTLNRNNEEAVLETSKKTFAQFDAEIRRKNLTMAVLGTLIMAFVVVTLQYPWNEPSGVYDRSYASMHGVEVVCSCLTALLMYCVYDYYKLQVDLDRLRYKQKFRVPLYKTNFFIPFVLEMAVCFLHPVPWTDQRKMGMLAFMKLYLWIRVYRDFSSVYRWRQDAVDACDVSHGIPQFTSWLSIRTLFYQSPWMFVLSSVVISVILLSFMIHVVEREQINESCMMDPCNCPSAPGTYQCLTPRGTTRTVTAAEVDPFRSCCHSPFKSPAVCVYYTSVTMTTVGFGDYTTLSSWGRGISMWAAIMGLCLSALLITALLTEFSLSFSQKFAADFVSIKHLTLRERELAARLIQRWWRRLRLNKGHYRGGERTSLNVGNLGGLINSGKDQSHLPSSKTRAQHAGIFNDTVDESLLWALKDFRQHRLEKEQTLTMDSEGGTGLYKSIIQMTRAYELMTEKIVGVDKQQRKFQLTLKKLVTLFAKLPQAMDPDALIPLGLGATISDQSNNPNSAAAAAAAAAAVAAAGSNNNNNNAASAAAQAQAAQAQAQLMKQNEQLAKLQKQLNSTYQELEDAKGRAQRAEDLAERTVQAAKNATVTQGPLRYKRVSSVIPGLQSVAVGGMGPAAVPAAASSSSSSSAASVSSVSTSSASAATTVTQLSYGGASRGGIAAAADARADTRAGASSREPSSGSSAVPSLSGQAASALGDGVLAVQHEAPSAADLDDPNAEWEEVDVVETAGGHQSVISRTSMTNNAAILQFQQQMMQQQQGNSNGVRLHRGVTSNQNGDEDEEEDEESVPTMPSWNGGAAGGATSPRYFN